MMKCLIAGIAASLALSCSSFAYAEYKGAPRTFLFNPSLDICIHETTQYKKAPPYVIGFSNAGVGDPWRVVMLHNIEQAAADNRDKISRLIITDAGHNDAKQVSDIQDLVSQQPDILIVSANTQQALDPAVAQATAAGIPVVMVDRTVKSEDNYVTFVAGSSTMAARLYAQWIVEKLNYKGNVVLMGGLPGTSFNDTRVTAAKQVFSQYPDIHILDEGFSDWSSVKSKQIMNAWIVKYGHDINAVWSAAGAHNTGLIEAFIESGWKSGEIPPITSSSLNGPLQLALKYKIPMLDIGYPPHMGYTAVEVALKVLNGVPMPCNYEVTQNVLLTDGDETPSVRADMWIKDVVDPNGTPDEMEAIEHGLGPNYDPTTFSVDYPR